jgi:hypothetical protein
MKVLELKRVRYVMGQRRNQEETDQQKRGLQVGDKFKRKDKGSSMVVRMFGIVLWLATW